MQQTGEKIIWQGKIGDWECQTVEVTQPTGKIFELALWTGLIEEQENTFRSFGGWGCPTDRLTPELLFAVGKYLTLLGIREIFTSTVYEFSQSLNIFYLNNPEETLDEQDEESDPYFCPGWYDPTDPERDFW